MVSVVVAGDWRRGMKRHATAASSASADWLTANKQIMCVSVIDDYTISSGADCLRYCIGQDFPSISQYCLIDSSPKWMLHVQKLLIQLTNQTSIILVTCMQVSCMQHSCIVFGARNLYQKKLVKKKPRRTCKSTCTRFLHKILDGVSPA